MESPDTWICIDGHDGRSSDAENDEEEFAALKGTMKEKDYKKQLQKKNLDSTLFEDTGLTDEDIEEMRLPANYFVLNPLREDTAESTIEAFVRSIQKVDRKSVV